MQIGTKRSEKQKCHCCNERTTETLFSPGTIGRLRVQFEQLDCIEIADYVLQLK